MSEATETPVENLLFSSTVTFDTVQKADGQIELRVNASGIDQIEGGGFPISAIFAREVLRLFHSGVLPEAVNKLIAGAPGVPAPEQEANGA